MLPGIDLNAGYSNDNSKYLLNNDWISYGASISWNLVNVFNSNLNYKLAKTQIELAKEQKWLYQWLLYLKFISHY